MKLLEAHLKICGSNGDASASSGGVEAGVEGSGGVDMEGNIDENNQNSIN